MMAASLLNSGADIQTVNEVKKHHQISQSYLLLPCSCNCHTFPVVHRHMQGFIKGGGGGGEGTWPLQFRAYTGLC